MQTNTNIIAQDLNQFTEGGLDSPLDMYHQRFLDTAKKKEELIEALKEVNKVLEESMEYIYTHSKGYLQDPTTGVVFKVIEPDGQYVVYKKFDYVRTKKSQEESHSGRLAKSEAEEMGFTNIPNYKK